MLVSLVKPAKAEQAEQMHALVGPPIQALMLHHQDSGILQSCCQYLKYVSGDTLLCCYLFTCNCGLSVCECM